MDAVLLLVTSSLSLSSVATAILVAPSRSDTVVGVPRLSLSENTSRKLQPQQHSLFDVWWSWLSMPSRVVLFWAFHLFTLSVIECCPSSWLLLIAKHDRDSSNLTTKSMQIPLTTAYSIVLWALCLCVLVLFPARIGSRILVYVCECESFTSTSNTTQRAITRIFSRTGIVIAVTLQWLWWLLRHIGGYCVNQWLLHHLRKRRRWDNISRRFESVVVNKSSLPLHTSNHHSPSLTSLSRSDCPQFRRRHSLLLFKPILHLSYCKLHPFISSQQSRRIVAFLVPVLGAVMGMMGWGWLLHTLAPQVIQIPQPVLRLSTMTTTTTTTGTLNSFYDNYSIISYFFPPHPPPHVLTFAVSWLCAVGILIASVLNGFASVSFPYSCFIMGSGSSNSVHNNTDVSCKSIARAEAALYRLHVTYQERQSERVRLLSVMKSKTKQKQQSSSSSTHTLSLLSTSPSTSPLSTSSSSISPSFSIPPVASVSTGISTSSSSSPSSFSSSFWGEDNTDKKTTTSTTDDRETIESLRRVQQDLVFLSSLIEETRDDVHEIKSLHDVAIQRAQQTPLRRRLSAGLGVILSILLIVRLVIILLIQFQLLPRPLQLWWWNVNSPSTTVSTGRTSPTAFSSSSSSDVSPAAAVAWTGMTQEHIDHFSQLFSMILSAFLSVSQVRTFGRAASTLHRKVASFFHMSCGCSSNYTSTSTSTAFIQETSSYDPFSTPTSTGSSSSPVISVDAALDTSATSLSYSSSSPTPLSISIASSVYSMIVATLAGCYCVACVVLTKRMLPETYRQSFSNALVLGENGSNGHGSNSSNGSMYMYYRVRSEMVDVTFGVSALVGVCVLSLFWRMQTQNAQRRYHDDAYDDYGNVEKCWHGKEDHDLSITVAPATGMV